MSFVVSSKFMGCCGSEALTYEKAKPSATTDTQILESSIILDNTNTWTPISESERADIANALHMCPFPDGRKNVLQGLSNRLLSCSDLSCLFVHLPTDAEKFQAVETLNGNLTDRASQYRTILKCFTDDNYKHKAASVLTPRRPTSQTEGSIT